MHRNRSNSTNSNRSFHTARSTSRSRSANRSGHPGANSATAPIGRPRVNSARRRLLANIVRARGITRRRRGPPGANSARAPRMHPGANSSTL